MYYRNVCCISEMRFNTLELSLFRFVFFYTVSHNEFWMNERQKNEMTKKKKNKCPSAPSARPSLFMLVPGNI